MEKLAETRMGYNEVTFLSDRVCGICGFAHSVAYTNSVENALGIEVPQRAHPFARFCWKSNGYTVICSTLASPAILLGFDTGFMQFFATCGKSR